MTYPDHIERFNAPSSKVAVIYSTKDRCHLTEQTWPRVAGERGCDVYWLDGSVSEAGRSLPLQWGRQSPNVIEAHLGVTGGPDVAIVYGLSHLLARGYEYIGLVENDVLSEPGWLAAAMDLFAIGAADGLAVGAATVRTFDKRILWRRRSYAVLFGSGAGTIVFPAPAVRLILQTYRTTTMPEVRKTFQNVAGRDVALTWEFDAERFRTVDSVPTSADWYWDAALAKHGLWVLGAIPSRATNIDADLHQQLGIEPVTADGDTHDGNRDFEAWRSQVTEPGHAAATVVGPDATHHLDPRHRRWIVHPHQVAAAVPGAFDDGWTLEANQFSGPFTFRAHRAGARLRLPVNGPGHLVLAADGERPSGQLHHHHHFGSSQDRSVRYSDHTALAERSVRHFDVRQFEARVVEFVADAPGVGVEALVFEDAQPWMYRRSDFSFETIRPFLADQTSPHPGGTKRLASSGPQEPAR